MIISMELKKMRRTGFYPAFIGGGVLGALIPILNMAVRSKVYTGLKLPPVLILMDANWQLMAMLNVLFASACACIMYHTENADSGLQKLRSLPVRESGMFFGKLGLTFIMCAAALVIEAASIGFCALHWFGSEHGELLTELGEYFGFALLLMLPAATASLFIASVWSNMWTALGVCVICVFTASMLPAESFTLSLFPFALPFRMFPGAGEELVNYAVAAGVETAVFAVAEILLIKIRRALK